VNRSIESIPVRKGEEKMKFKKFKMPAAWITAVILLTAVSLARAAAPGLIHHQGFLTDELGTPINGIVEIAFSLYDQEIGGSEVWSEGPVSVTATDGLFQVTLGQTTPLTPSMLSGPRWLEVIVDGEYLEPRERIVSVLFAVESQNADLLDGAEAADLEESAEIDADIAGHAALSDAHHAKTTSFAELTDAAADVQIPDDITVNYAAAAGSAATAGDADTVDGLDASDFAAAGHLHDGRYYTRDEVDTLIQDLEETVIALSTLLSNVTRDGDDIYFKGMNVHIVNGSGSTDGTVDGLGNLIVGYNETRDDGTDVRSGSHNIVTGSRNNYASYGGFVAGSYNEISGTHASVSGGNHNTASGASASVSGGSGNTADGLFASVSGGFGNAASGVSAGVSGGYYNTAWGDYTGVAGGKSNYAIGIYSSVTGGYMNDASGNASSVSGGYENVAGGENASVSGGDSNHAVGPYASISGGMNCTASATGASISGGSYNISSGNYASVGGGRFNEASGYHAFVGGGGGEYETDGNEASGDFSSVAGGSLNAASGAQSSVSGGYSNSASGVQSSVTGGTINFACGTQTIVSGGSNNQAMGENASVGGGLYNSANGEFSSVSGGYSGTAGGINDWVAGSLWEDD